MPYIEPEVILEAKKIDLLTYLQNYEPQELQHVSGNIYCISLRWMSCLSALKCGSLTISP